MGLRNERLRWQLATGLLSQLHLERLSRRFEPQVVLAAFNFVNGAVSIGLIATVALLTQEAFIFPSLGATAFILFYVPLAQPASPRNALCGHLVGAVAGWISLLVFGLLDAPSAMAGGVDWPRVGAAALSLGTTSSMMVLLRVSHPPAGATALIVSLGLMPHLGQIPILLCGVSLLLAQAFVMNRLAGIPYPLWSAKKPVESPLAAQLVSGAS